MKTDEKPKKVAGFILIGIVFLVFGIWMLVNGVGAIRSGKIIPGGSRAKPMTGIESVLLGSAAIGIGAYGVWLGIKGKRY